MILVISEALIGPYGKIGANDEMLKDWTKWKRREEFKLPMTLPTRTRCWARRKM